MTILTTLREYLACSYRVKIPQDTTFSIQAQPMLIALLSGQRCQNIHALDINSMKVEVHSTQQYVLQMNQLLKTFRPGKHFNHLVLQSYPENKQLCICEVLQTYLAKTKPLRANYTQLLINYQKPH